MFVSVPAFVNFASVPPVANLIVPVVDKYTQIIKNTSYIQNCKRNNKKDIHSISYLIDAESAKKMSQSDCIKLGHGIEHFFRNIVLQNGVIELRDIRPPQKSKKGNKEMDHLFEDAQRKIIYYAELKSSLNLDTEKFKATCQKCIDNGTKLREMYPDHEIKMFLVGNRYLEKSEIEKHKKITDKYKLMIDNVCGVNDYFRNLGIPHMCFESETQYRTVLNTIVMEMFKYGDGCADDGDDDGDSLDDESILST